MILSIEPASPDPLADLFRVFFVMTPAFLIVGMTVFIMINYCKSWRLNKKKGMTRRGLLPLYAWTIALSYLLLLLDAVITVFENKAGEITIHTFVRGFAALLGAFALGTLLKYGRLRSLEDKRADKEIKSVARF